LLADRLAGGVALAWMAATVMSCGSGVSHDPLAVLKSGDGGGAAERMSDAQSEAAPDAPTEAAPDARTEAALDAPIETAPDAPAGGALDAATDGGPDAPTEDASDAATKGALDASMEDARDAATDGAPDAPSETALDTSSGVAAEALPDGAAWDVPSETGAATCSSSLRFDRPVEILGLEGDRRQRIPRLSPDELTVYFSRDLGDLNELQILTARRSSRGASFAAPQLIDEVESPHEDVDISVTGDGLRLFVESTRDQAYSIFESTRATLDAPFSTPALMTALGPTGAEGGPYVLPQGTSLYFHSYRSGNPDIYVATPLDSATQVAWVEGINTAAEESFPVVSADELTIYFSSDRSDGGAAGGVDIWMATRPTRNQAFGSPINVSELNTRFGERPSWISPDGCRLYLQRDSNEDPVGFATFYVAERLH
jgi:hypothetical protein